MAERIEANSKIPKSRPRHPDRVALKPDHLAKIQSWIAQVTSKHRGVRITKNDLITWLIDSQPDLLPETSESDLARQHYDEERFLRETLREFKKCRAQGLAFDWRDVLARDQRKPIRRPRKKSQENTGK
jgi:hypothetical protein